VLDIDVSDAVSPSLDLDRLKSSLNGGPIGIWNWQHENLSEVFTKSWLAHMKQIGLNVGTCLVFYRDTHYLYPSVHVDVYNQTGNPIHYAINWILDPDDDSEMIWYTYPKDATKNRGARTPADINYMYWELDNFTGQEICRHTVKNRLTLVNTSMPHNVETKTRPRWAFSARFSKDTNDGASESWQRAVEFFRPYFKTAS
jgi:hypothetical protein